MIDNQILTIALILITLFYAIQTRKTVTEISKQRRDSQLPVIIPEGFEFNQRQLKAGEKDSQHAYCLNTHLKNVGAGPALEIEVDFNDSETDEPVASSVHLIDYLNVGDSSIVHIHIPKKEFDSLRYREESGEMIARLRVFIEYKDIYKRKFLSHQNFRLKKESKQMEKIVGSFKYHYEDSQSLLLKILGWIV